MFVLSFVNHTGSEFIELVSDIHVYDKENLVHSELVAKHHAERIHRGKSVLLRASVRRIFHYNVQMTNTGVYSLSMSWVVQWLENRLSP